MSTPWHGLLLVDKPSGPTSHDIVDRIRRATGQRRIGHAGTLDPLASGLLPLVLGCATRLVRFMPHSPKVYSGLFRLGLVTLSDDCTGEVLSRHSGPLPTADDVNRTAGTLTGRQLQTPPTVSARKVGGKRMYRLAREGIKATAEPRPVLVDRFDIEPEDGAASDFRFVAVVSGGTYIRALVRDLGQALGCGATLVALRRDAIDSMRPSPRLQVGREAPPVDCLREELLPLNEIPLVAPTVTLSTIEQATRFRSGVALPLPDDPPPQGTCRVLDLAGDLIGMAESDGRLLQPCVVLVGQTG